MIALVPLTVHQIWFRKSLSDKLTQTQTIFQIQIQVCAVSVFQNTDLLLRRVEEEGGASRSNLQLGA